jgi:hypothetical protein
MKRLEVVLLLLSACAAPELPAPVPAAVTDWPVAAPETATPAANHAPATAAVSGYRKAEAAEVHAVTAPTATAASIARVGEADKLARQAVADLVAMNGQPTAAGIAKARRTLEELIRALEAPQ